MTVHFGKSSGVSSCSLHKANASSIAWQSAVVVFQFSPQFDGLLWGDVVLVKVSAYLVVDADFGVMETIVHCPQDVLGREKWARLVDCPLGPFAPALAVCYAKGAFEVGKLGAFYELVDCGDTDGQSFVMEEVAGGGIDDLPVFLGEMFRLLRDGAERREMRYRLRYRR